VNAMLSKWAGGMVWLAADGGGAAGGGGAAEAAPGPAGPLGSLFGSGMPLIIILVLLFYFLIIRPQSREQARRRAMLAAVKKNDRVVTAGGVYGVVTNVRPEADEVTVKVDEATNTKLRLTLSSIVRVLGEESSDEPAKK
jgi:preprotein translocase subunit YajC